MGRAPRGAQPCAVGPRTGQGGGTTASEPRARAVVSVQRKALPLGTSLPPQPAPGTERGQGAVSRLVRSPAPARNVPPETLARRSFQYNLYWGRLMGVRTRPGIKHDHRHNQQREALAEQHRNGIGPCSPPAAGWYPGLRRRHRLLPRGGRGGVGSAPLPGWMLGFRQCWGLLFPPGRRAPRGSSGLASLGAQGPGTACPRCRGVLGCGAQPHGSTRKLWLFLCFFFRFSFFAFLAANLSLQVPWKKQDCTQRAATLPAPPHRGQSRGAAPGTGLWAGARPLPPLPGQIPSLELAIWGTGPRTTPQAMPRAERQRMGTAQCLGERVAAWDGAAGDGQGKKRESSKTRIKWSFPQGPAEETGRVSARNRGACAAAWRGYNDSGARQLGR